MTFFWRRVLVSLTALLGATVVSAADEGPRWERTILRLRTGRWSELPVSSQAVGRESEFLVAIGFT
jgi:hypothetical protein